MTFRTHCAVRLGDNLAHLHFLRALAKAYPDQKFVHYAHRQYLPQLIEVVSDTTNVHLCDLETVEDGTGDYWSMRPHQLLRSVDAWKNAGGRWEKDEHRNDYANFMFRHFCGLAKRMGLSFVPPPDFLFDYPALQGYKYPAFDCLIVNSPPQSGQMPDFNPAHLENLIGELSTKMSCVATARNRFCPSTQDKMMSVTQIGALSRFCKYIVMVSTGPSWPTFNVWNKETIQLRVILIGEEEVNLAPNTVHAHSAMDARAVLRVRGIL
jgi:hypothetical protein